MEATRLQMQNFLIFLLDLVGVTVGYFAAVWLRFGNIETGYTVMGNDTYYRWLIAIVVLMMIYFLFRPNRGFFKRKFIEEMRMNLQTVILMAAGMAMVAFLIQDAEDYSRFIYIFTSGFGFVWMQIIHRAYRKYWLSRRKDHSYARKMMIITTSDHHLSCIRSDRKHHGREELGPVDHKCCSRGQRHDRMAYQRDSGCGTFVSKYF